MLVEGYKRLVGGCQKLVDGCQKSLEGFQKPVEGYQKSKYSFQDLFWRSRKQFETVPNVFPPWHEAFLTSNDAFLSSHNQLWPAQMLFVTSTNAKTWLHKPLVSFNVLKLSHNKQELSKNNSFTSYTKNPPTFQHDPKLRHSYLTHLP